MAGRFLFHLRLPTFFQSGGNILHYLPARYENSSCLIFTQTFGTVSPFNLRHSDTCVVVSYCGVNLNFFMPNDVEPFSCDDLPFVHLF